MKYIVYQTINVINNKIYIGVHKTKNPDIFDGYVGCGCSIHEPNMYNNPKTPFQFAVKKYGINNFKRTILKVFDNIDDADFTEALESLKKQRDDNLLLIKTEHQMRLESANKLAKFEEERLQTFFNVLF